MRYGAVLLIAVAAAGAQTFEVASVKPSGPDSVRGSAGGPGSPDPGRYHFNSATFLDLVAIAYKVEYFQVFSKTPLDRDRFDLAANVPAGVSRDEFRVMLQNLLAERFRLRLHKEVREFPAYELVVAKSGLKLKESAPSPPRPGFPDLPPGRPGLTSRHSIENGHHMVRMRAQQMPVSTLAEFIRLPGETPIRDRSGLTGKYDFMLEYETAAGATSSDGIPEAPLAGSVFTAVQEQLGLQLVPKRLPFEVLVIESFDRVPSGN